MGGARTTAARLGRAGRPARAEAPRAGRRPTAAIALSSGGASTGTNVGVPLRTRLYRAAHGAASRSR